MDRFDLLEAKMKINGEKVFYVKAQLNHYMSDPQYHVLVTEVKHNKGITPPFNRLYNSSLSDFMDKLYEFKLSFDESEKREYSQLEIKMEKVDAIKD